MRVPYLSVCSARSSARRGSGPGRSYFERLMHGREDVLVIFIRDVLGLNKHGPNYSCDQDVLVILLYI